MDWEQPNAWGHLEDEYDSNAAWGSSQHPSSGNAAQQQQQQSGNASTVGGAAKLQNATAGGAGAAGKNPANLQHGNTSYGLLSRALNSGTTNVTTTASLNQASHHSSSSGVTPTMMNTAANNGSSASGLFTSAGPDAATQVGQQRQHLHQQHQGTQHAQPAHQFSFSSQQQLNGNGQQQEQMAQTQQQQHHAGHVQHQMTQHQTLVNGAFRVEQLVEVMISQSPGSCTPAGIGGAGSGSGGLGGGGGSGGVNIINVGHYQHRPPSGRENAVWGKLLVKNERLRLAVEEMARRKLQGQLRLDEFRTILDVILQDKLGFEVASYVGTFLLANQITPNSHFFSIFCLVFSRDPSLEGYEKVSQMFQYVRPLNAHTFASLIRCHGALHDSISAVRVLKHFREILHTLSANDLKYRFTVYQAAHDVCLRSEWSHQVQLWIQDDQVTGVDGGRKPPPPEGLPKIYLKDDRPAISTSEAMGQGLHRSLNGVSGGGGVQRGGTGRRGTGGNYQGPSVDPHSMYNTHLQNQPHYNQHLSNGGGAAAANHHVRPLVPSPTGGGGPHQHHLHEADPALGGAFGAAQVAGGQPQPHHQAGAAAYATSVGQQHHHHQHHQLHQHNNYVQHGGGENRNAGASIDQIHSAAEHHLATAQRQHAGAHHPAHANNAPPGAGNNNPYYECRMPTADHTSYSCSPVSDFGGGTCSQHQQQQVAYNQGGGQHEQVNAPAQHHSAQHSHSQHQQHSQFYSAGGMQLEHAAQQLQNEMAQPNNGAAAQHLQQHDQMYNGVSSAGNGGTSYGGQDQNHHAQQLTALGNAGAAPASSSGFYGYTSHHQMQSSPAPTYTTSNAAVEQHCAGQGHFTVQHQLYSYQQQQPQAGFVTTPPPGISTVPGGLADAEALASTSNHGGALGGELGTEERGRRSDQGSGVHFHFEDQEGVMLGAGGHATGPQNGLPADGTGRGAVVPVGTAGPPGHEHIISNSSHDLSGGAVMSAGTNNKIQLEFNSSRNDLVLDVPTAGHVEGRPGQGGLQKNNQPGSCYDTQVQQQIPALPASPVLPTSSLRQLSTEGNLHNPQSPSTSRSPGKPMKPLRSPPGITLLEDEPPALNSTATWPFLSEAAGHKQSGQGSTADANVGNPDPRSQSMIEPPGFFASRDKAESHGQLVSMSTTDGGSSKESLDGFAAQKSSSGDLRASASIEALRSQSESRVEGRLPPMPTHRPPPSPHKTSPQKSNSPQKAFGKSQSSSPAK